MKVEIWDRSLNLAFRTTYNLLLKCDTHMDNDNGEIAYLHLSTTTDVGKKLKRPNEDFRIP
jgi:hypothetical protein